MNYKNQREINRITMTDTLEMCETNPSLKSAIENSIAGEHMVMGDVMIDPLPWVQHETKYVVSDKKTYEASGNYPGKKVCILNFANNHSIGGAPFSANAQEESLCRTSTLYPCLEAMREEFYDRHIHLYENGILDYMGNDDLIYTPDVVVFKTQQASPNVMSENEWHKVNVITCAAPQLRDSINLPENYEDIIRKRIRRILLVAAQEGNEVLILGAWGCGAFHNPPEAVAGIFMEELPAYGFETVEFAVYCHDDKTNYEIFREALEKATAKSE